MHLEAKPCTLRQANDLVDDLHRHHDPVTGHRFSVSAWAGNKLVGVAIVGRPVGPNVPQYSVAEVTRLVTDGTRNACSFLYARCARADEAIGFDWIQTYTLQSEPGTSLRACGWICDGVVRKDGKGWTNRPGRKDKNTEPKVRWRKVLK